jgi:hypothetical protein|tara:strand:- start:546 stop:659 length:114 start_codon:yes stop_codon:yes gene_type:complete
MEMPESAIMNGGMQIVKNNLNQLKTELQKKEKQRFLG